MSPSSGDTESSDQQCALCLRSYDFYKYIGGKCMGCQGDFCSACYKKHRCPEKTMCIITNPEWVVNLFRKEDGI